LCKSVSLTLFKITYYAFNVVNSDVLLETLNALGKNI